MSFDVIFDVRYTDFDSNHCVTVKIYEILTSKLRYSCKTGKVNSKQQEMTQSTHENQVFLRTARVYINRNEKINKLDSYFRTHHHSGNIFACKLAIDKHTAAN